MNKERINIFWNLSKRKYWKLNFKKIKAQGTLRSSISKIYSCVLQLNCRLHEHRMKEVCSLSAAWWKYWVVLVDCKHNLQAQSNLATWTWCTGQNGLSGCIDSEVAWFHPYAQPWMWEVIILLFCYNEATSEEWGFGYICLRDIDRRAGQRKERTRVRGPVAILRELGIFAWEEWRLRVNRTFFNYLNDTDVGEWANLFWVALESKTRHVVLETGFRLLQDQAV